MNFMVYKTINEIPKIEQNQNAATTAKTNEKNKHQSASLFDSQPSIMYVSLQY